MNSALGYFIDTCYELKHAYKCVDAEDQMQKELVLVLEIGISLDPEIQLSTKIPALSYTSAENYFSEIEIDVEVYDELLELERKIDILAYATSYTEDLTISLMNFFVCNLYVIKFI